MLETPMCPPVLSSYSLLGVELLKQRVTKFIVSQLLQFITSIYGIILKQMKSQHRWDGHI